MEEEWKLVEGFAGILEVSNLGRFRNNSTNKVYKLSTYSNGYLQVSVVVNYKRYTAISHRLVAKTFIPNPENKCCVNHKNGIKTDNRIENLEWVTHSENVKHSINVLNRNFPSQKGEDNPKSILTEKDVLEIRKLYSEGFTQTELAKRFQMKLPAIYKIVTRRTWKHI